MKEIEVQFAYKGGRDYVHGTDMYESLLACLNGSSASKLSLMFKGLVRQRSCLMRFSSDKTAIQDYAAAKFKGSFSDASGEKVYFAMSEVAHAGRGSYPYDELEIRSSCLLNGLTLRLTVNRNFTMIENVVAATKYLHETVYQDEKGKWLFVQLQIDRPLPEADVIELVIEKKGSTRLSLASIFCDGAKVGKIYFSLVKA